jgi:hypothetical protein
MLIALAALLGVPLWFIAAVLAFQLRRARGIKRRPGNVPNRSKAIAEERWRRGHGVWVHDVFAWVAAPPSLKEYLGWVTRVEQRAPTAGEAKRFRRLGADPLVLTLHTAAGPAYELAVAGAHRDKALGPFADEGASAVPPRAHVAG